ncbi:type II/IV secretion system protein [Lutibacter sp. HS1-25]|uniref:GspE/PulE family protein n=1 Tax=Lutibacter sp. HS1-25 TaxID=2485000 RepID=UPI0010121DAD|nr:GspE/PulE family protein [Lutibacter sp. HS1-25]RXP46188.1 type II/IV secretion system protein [Lutibacter sp. HS1-25]
MVDVNFHIETSLQQLLTPEQAFAYQIIPAKEEADSITFKTVNNNSSLKQELEIILGKKVQLVTESKENIQLYLNKNYRINSASKSQSLNYSDDFLLKIIDEAKNSGSSDIHFEIFELKAKIRFRIDGKLIEKFVIPLSEYPVIINRIKIMAGMDISEKRLPQDGRITINTENSDFDIRASALPTLHGEKMVLRLLSKDTNNIQLENLGFTDSELQSYRESIKKPHGIILISGPTGSGKTTTLYATLKELNNVNTNILTIEDPIEYTLEGINQVQLKESIGLDFASTLRTFLRQDPDIIMVGEIRDVETANMAIRAALTGHLVLSTIHTNSAWATITRLIDMGIPPFLVASTLNVSIAQRLVRKLCDSCKKEELVTASLFPKKSAIPSNLKKHFVPVGCNECYHTGYNGRKAIYEIIPLDDFLITQIKNEALDVDTYLAEENIATLKANAYKLIEQGITAIEEVYTMLTD